MRELLSWSGGVEHVWSTALPAGDGIHVLAAHRLLDHDNAVVFEQRSQIGNRTEADIPELAKLVGDFLDVLVTLAFVVELDGGQVHRRQFDVFGQTLRDVERPLQPAADPQAVGPRMRFRLRHVGVRNCSAVCLRGVVKNPAAAG